MDVLGEIAFSVLVIVALLLVGYYCLTRPIR